MAIQIIQFPPLYGGVSRQSPAERHLNQVEEAQNALFSVIDGFLKRPGTVFVGKIDKLQFTGATWTASTKTLTANNAFIQYTHVEDTLVHLSGGTGVKWGIYRVASRVSDHAITLVDSLSDVDLSAGDISGGLIGSENYRIHPINRDGSEQYLILYGPLTLRVFDLSGREQAVTMTEDARNYLSVNDSGMATGAIAGDLILTTIADTTIIGNSRVSMRAKASAHFTVTSTQNTYDDLITTTPAASTYHRVLKASGGFPAGYYQYTPGASLPAIWRGVWVGPGFIEAWRLDDPSYNPGRFQIQFDKPDAFKITNGTWTAATKRLTSVGAFNGYSWASGDQIYIASGTGATPGLYDIASKIDNDNITLATSIAVGDLTTGDIATGVYVLKAIGEINVTANFFDSPKTMTDVANEIQTHLQVFHPNIICLWEQRDATTGRFVITGPFTGIGATVGHPTDTDAQTAGTDISAKLAQTTWFSKISGSLSFQERNALWKKGLPIPTFKSAAEIIPGSGDPKAKTLDVHERWTRVAAPGQKEAELDASTLPIRLTRFSVGFTDHSGVFHPGTWSAELNVWQPRKTGDQLSNPIPSFLASGSKTLMDIAFVRSRMGIASDESFVLSQTDDFFNFFLDDPSNVLDSDPIDRSLSVGPVALIDKVVIFRKSVVIFSKAELQFEFNAPDELTPKTATITPTTAYASIPNLRPKIMGNQLYFVANNIQSATVYEYFYEDSQASNLAADITRHVPRYIPPNITRLDVSLTNQALFLLDSEGKQLYVYQQYREGVQKAQSAWGRYVFHPDERIVDIGVLRDSLYLLMETRDGYVLEKMATADENPSYRSATWFGVSQPNLDVSVFNTISDGSFRIKVDGVERDVSALNFTAHTTMVQVAATISAGLAAVFGTTTPPTCRWHQSRQLVITSGTEGPSSSVSIPTAHSSGTGTNLATASLLGTPGVAYGPQMLYEPKIDRRMELMGVYNAATNLTTWTLPIEDDSMDIAVLGRDFGSESGQYKILTRPTPGSATMIGDYSGGPVWIGRSYGMDVQLSRPYPRDVRGNPMIGSSATILDLHIEHSGAGAYSVLIQQPGKPDVPCPLELFPTIPIGGSMIQDQGGLTCPVNGRSDETSLHIINSTPLPCRINGARMTLQVEDRHG